MTSNADSNNYKVLIALMGMEIGGAETHVLELCKALSRKGLDVYVVSNGGAYEQDLVACGIKHYRVPLHNKHPRNMISSYLMIRKIIKENDIHLVHAHARIPAFICGLLKKTMDFRFVTTAHLNFSTAFPYKLLTNWGEASLAVAEDIKEYLIENYGLSGDKILLTINGVDTERFTENVDYSDVVEEFRLDKNKRHIVYISRMDSDRSLPAHRLIECAESLHNHNSDIEIVIVGGGNDFENVNNKAQAVNNRLGFELIKITNNRTDIHKFAALADVFIGVSRSALEAMSARRPLILAGNQGHIGIFDQDSLDISISTNFCCRGCDDVTAERLEADILKLLSLDSEALAELGDYNREIIKQHYSIERMADDALALYELVRKVDRPIDAMISGYYGSRNHGDDALLKSITDDLRRMKPDINIVVLSKHPRITTETFGVRSIYRFNLPQICKYLKQTNLMISGGGSLVQDVTSTRSLIYYLYIINSAYKAGAANMLYANGIGPLRESNKKRAAATLERVDLITLRDEVSMTALEDLQVKHPKVAVTADPVFGLKNTEPQRSQDRLETLGLNGKQFFCVAVRSWKNLGPNFECDMAEFCRYIKDTYGYLPLFIPMQPQKDAEISQRIMNACGGIYLGDEFSVNEILGIAQRSEFMIGMRYHSIIYAAGMGTPVIGLVYDPKVEGVMKSFGQQYYVKVENIDLQRLIDYADEIIANRGVISEELLKVSAEFEDKAFENAQMAYDLMNRNIF